MMMPDIFLPDPYTTQEAICWSAYKVGRRAAVYNSKWAIACIHELHGFLHEIINGRQMTIVEMVERSKFAGLQLDFYRARMVMLRSYARYVRSVHGPSKL